MPTMLDIKTTAKDKIYDYDLIVIGGGSGGLASSKAAASYDKRVAVFDFVTPSPIGTKWGLGGTCVNVGCIPKKLMHQCAILGEEIKHISDHYGWTIGNYNSNNNKELTVTSLSNGVNHTTSPSEDTNHSAAPSTPGHQSMLFNWNTLVEAVQNHIHSLNFKYKSSLRAAKVTYVNAYAKFVDEHTVETTDRKGKVTLYTAANFIIATGLRPNYLPIPGAKEYCVTSDDLFSLPYPPGKTLCVGASYISLECAGFLNGIGFPVTVMVRSILLRGFDRGMADTIGDFMARQGVRFIHQAIPIKIEKLQDGTPGLYKVYYKREDGSEDFETFNTILLAIGREARTQDLNLETIKVKVNPKNRKLMTNKYEQTSVPHIYAIGDNADGKPELTPVAIYAGRLLARRLFDPEGFTELCDYSSIPTTVFTPLEYGACGLSEEEAKAKFKPDDVEVYIRPYRPIDWVLSNCSTKTPKTFFKLIAIKSLAQKVVGFHVVGPHAGEYMQGYAVPLKMNAKLNDFVGMLDIAFPDIENVLSEVKALAT